MDAPAINAQESTANATTLKPGYVSGPERRKPRRSKKVQMLMDYAEQQRKEK